MWLGLLGLSCLGLTTHPAAPTPPLQNFIPGGSYALDFFNANDAHFTSVGDPSSIYFSGAVPYEDPANQRELASICDTFKANPYIAEDTVSCWYDAFQKSSAAGGADFYPQLKAFLDADGKRFSNDIVLGADGKIVASRFTGQHTKAAESTERIAGMDSVRADVGAVGGAFGRDARVYGFTYLNIEQFKAIKQEAIRNIGFALLMIFVVIALLMSKSPAGVVIVFLCIAAIVVEILGYLHFWGTSIDSVSVIMLVISLGLSVDYVTHLGHNFIMQGGSAADKLVGSMSEMGTAVFNGAFSTFLSILLLSASSSYVFITMFKVLVLVTTLALAHALVLLPLLLYAHAAFSQAKKAP